MRAVLSQVLACVGAAPRESAYEPDSDLESLLEPPPRTAHPPWPSPASAAAAVLARLRQSHQTATSRTPAHSTDDVC
jgi:hypothetical protein